MSTFADDLDAKFYSVLQGIQHGKLWVTNMGYTYVIEHMEEDESTPACLPRWVELEYCHMTDLAGTSASVQFTHLSSNSRNSLRTKLSTFKCGHQGMQYSASYEVHTTSILELLQEKNVPLHKVCLLDPKAEKVLDPGDKDEFAWFLFGVNSERHIFLVCVTGFSPFRITGDDPPRDRTAELRKLGFPSRHLGPVQMTTDTALGVTKRVIDDGIPLDQIPYVVRDWIVNISGPRFILSVGFPDYTLQCAREHRNAIPYVDPLSFTFEMKLIL
ncbi:hypothetical protein ID866_10109 [Astraeus odoratus]|nr:hypothetical protein ID866_10109 [Astraeus odoratus]